MTRDDLDELKKILAATFDVYRRELTGMQLKMWAATLQAYDIAVIRQGLTAHMRNPDNGQFAPVPADIVKLIEGGSDDVALQAWAKVDRAIRTVGAYQSVVFDDRLIHYALEQMGGWILMGSKREEEMPFLRNQFVTLYRGARQRDVTFPARLIGIAEAHNDQANKRIAPPVFLGNEVLARVIYSEGKASPIAIAAPKPVRELVPALEHHT